MQKLTGDPKRLEVFVRAVDCGSFSALARAWRQKPSSVSRQVAQLEAELGVRLLARTTRQLHLTEAGTQLYERARAALDDLDDALRSAAAFSAAPRGRLRLAAPMAFGTRYLGPLVAPFAAEFPSLDLEIVLQDRFVDLVGEGFDAAIRAGHVKDEGVVARRLAPNDRVLIASPAYLAAQGPIDAPEALAEHDALVLRYVDATDEWRFRAPAAPGTVSPVIRVQVRARVASNNGDLLMQAATDGVGVALVPRWLAADALREGKVRAVLPGFEATATDFDSVLHVLYPTRRFVPAKVRVLLSFLEARFAPPPWVDVAKASDDERSE